MEPQGRLGEEGQKGGALAGALEDRSPPPSPSCWPWLQPGELITDFCWVEGTGCSEGVKGQGQVGRARLWGGVQHQQGPSQSPVCKSGWLERYGE